MTKTSEASKEKMLRISSAAKAAGVSRGTVEYYIMLGLIEPIRQRGRPARFFDDVLVRHIRLIRRLNRSGYTLRDIRQTYLQGSRRGEASSRGKG